MHKVTNRGPLGFSIVFGMLRQEASPRVAVGDVMLVQRSSTGRIFEIKLLKDPHVNSIKCTVGQIVLRRGHQKKSKMYDASFIPRLINKLFPVVT